MATKEQPQPPDGAYIRQRWVKPEEVSWVEECDRIMIEYGRVDGSGIYPTKTRARYQARKLKDLMVRLRKHEGWQLVEHTWRGDGGWRWSLEYIPRELR